MPGRTYPTCISALAKCVSTRSCSTLFSADGSPLPLEKFGEAIDAPEHDALA
jgi:hypothetical protein